MSEIIISVLFVLFVLYHFLYVREVGKRQHELTKAIMAKNLREFDDSNVIEDGLKTNKDGKIEQNEGLDDFADLVPMDSVGDELFDKHIKAIQEDQNLE